MNIFQAKIAAKRVMKRCNILATFSESKNELTRLYLSPEHIKTNICIGEWMKIAGMTIWQDAVCNICGRYEGIRTGAPAVLLGSHLDTVRNAGRYDGTLGVLVAIEIVQWLHNQQIKLPMSIEIIGFGDEEGTRFGTTLLGSRGITGTWLNDWLSYKDSNGITIAEAMNNLGIDSDNITDAIRNTNEITAYFELHIEQGLHLKQKNLPLGVVTSINGARRFNCSFVGETGHAGTVPMIMRKDALIAAAEWILFINQTTLKQTKIVATVGSLICNPGVVNVIPGEVNLSLDIRGSDDVIIESTINTLLIHANNIASYRGLIFNSNEYYRTNITICNNNLKLLLVRAIKSIQGRSLLLSSWAGHDAVAISKNWPIGMLFVRNKSGVSHNPLESVTIKDVEFAIQAYSKAIYQFAIT